MILSKFQALVILYSDSIVRLLMRPSGFWRCLEVFCGVLRDNLHKNTAHILCFVVGKSGLVGVNERESKVKTYSSSKSQSMSETRHTM